MNISLTKEMEEMIQQKVRQGGYATASEVVREALRMMQERDQLLEIRREELRREVQKGIDSAERGEVTEWDVEKFKAMAREYAAKKKRRA